MIAGVSPPSDPDRQTWATPPELFAQIHREYNFTVDACALPRNAKLPRFWSPKEDGLAQRWDGERVWCNPPYENITPWMARAYHASQRGIFSALLVPVRADIGWWHDYAVHGELHFFRRRIGFIPPPGIDAGSQTEASVLVVFDDASARSSQLRIFSRSANNGGYLLSRQTAEQLDIF